MESPVTSVRAFIGIPLPVKLIAEIEKLQQVLDQDLRKPIVRWTKSDQIHLTLQFLGNVRVQELPQIEDALRTACRGTSSIHLQLHGIGCFPSFRRPSVIWLGLQGEIDRLQQMQKQVAANTQRFGSHAEDRDFHPHLTIGRVKAHDRDGEQIGRAMQDFRVPQLGEWTAQQVKLMRSRLFSQGSTYEELAAIPLGSD